MKPRIFIGSSVESIDVAYAAQEALEHTCEATVWDQGIFEPSKYAMASLIDAAQENDFGLFVFAPNDVTKLRGKDHATVRDNVIFELGLFIGRLGQERSFMVVPRGVEDLHLPTDLLGLTPATYEPDRQDGNLVAALGPAINRIKKAILRQGRFVEEVAVTEVAAAYVAAEVEATRLIGDPNDCTSLIQSWMGARQSAQNLRAIKYSDVDRELGLEPGSAERYIEQAATKFNYIPSRKGAETILFERLPQSRGVARPSYF